METKTVVQSEGTARMQALSQRVAVSPRRAVCRPVCLEVNDRRGRSGEQGPSLSCSGEFELTLHGMAALNSISSLAVSSSFLLTPLCQLL